MAVSIQASKGQLEPLQWLLGAIEHRHIAVLLHMEKSAPESEHNQLQKIVDSFRRDGPLPLTPCSLGLPRSSSDPHIQGHSFALYPLIFPLGSPLPQTLVVSCSFTLACVSDLSPHTVFPLPLPSPAPCLSLCFDPSCGSQLTAPDLNLSSTSFCPTAKTRARHFAAESISPSPE